MGRPRGRRAAHRRHPRRLHLAARVLQQATPPERTIAYFSPEFGISESLPQYSGGLGILAGDHLKAASDLGVPLVAVGLFYRQGFFRQRVTDGRQQEWYQAQHPSAMGLLDTGVEVHVPLGRVDVKAKVWRCDVGAVPLYLLDTYLPDNSHFDRTITDKLYGGDQEHRLRQELVLGVGGARALEALGIVPTKYHLNEGHAGLLASSSRSRAQEGRRLRQALAAIRPHAALHDPHAGAGRHRPLPPPPVPAYIEPWAYERKISMDDLFALGELPGDPDGDPFNMAAFCLASAGAWPTACRSCTVTVSREMFAALPLGPSITSVTNGVHAVRGSRRSCRTSSTTISARAGPRVTSTPGPRSIPSPFGHPRAVVREPALTSPTSSPRSRRASSTPNVLTIGFARRFATYKRASLLLPIVPGSRRSSPTPIVRCSSCSRARRIPPTKPARR